MSLKSSPTNANVAQLKSLLMRIGSATSGRKDSLVSRLSKDLIKSRIPQLGAHGIVTKTNKEGMNKTRILSIDMGIKNLAFCVADVEFGSNNGDEVPKSKTTTSKKKIREETPTPTKINIAITAWRRLDVADEVRKSLSDCALSTSQNTDMATITPVSSSVPQLEKDAQEKEEEDPYTPSALSLTAYNLLKHTLLPYNPDIILIERQRWRSTSSPSIQQWTVRVNTLEGMLWAILTAFRRENLGITSGSGNEGLKYDVFDVDPKRVGNFWLAGQSQNETTVGSTKQRKKIKGGVEIEEYELELGPEGEMDGVVEGAVDKTAVKKMTRSKAEKKAKMDILRSWLIRPSPATTITSTSSTPPITATTTSSSAYPKPPTSYSPMIYFSFSEQAATIRAALCEPPSKKKGTQKEKMDDVTDCFLQAAAWVAWEGNRVRILEEEWDVESNMLRADGKEEVEGEGEIREKTEKKGKKSEENGGNQAEKVKKKRKSKTEQVEGSEVQLGSELGR